MIYLLNYEGTSVISRTIKAITWSKFSHTAVAHESGMTVEAWHRGGVHIVSDPWKNHKSNTRVTVYALDINETIARQIWDAICSKIGNKYDFRALFGFVSLTRWMWKDDPDFDFCSHVSSWSCRQGGYPLFSPQTPLYKISPQIIDTTPVLSVLGVVTNLNEYLKIIVCGG